MGGAGGHKMVEEGGQQVGTAVVLAKTQIVPENRSRRQPLRSFLLHINERVISCRCSEYCYLTNISVDNDTTSFKVQGFSQCS